MCVTLSQFVTCARVLSHTRRLMAHLHVWHDWFICVTWNRVNKSHVHESCHIREDSWLIHMCDMTHLGVTWLIHVCDMTHLYVWQDSFICLPWNRVNKSHVHESSHIRLMAHSYVWHDSFLCVTCLISMCAMTYLYVWHDSFTCNRDNKSHVRESSYTFLMNTHHHFVLSLFIFFFPPTHAATLRRLPFASSFFRVSLSSFFLKINAWNAEFHSCAWVFGILFFYSCHL